jgi:biopolymer transport protein ExbD
MKIPRKTMRVEVPSLAMGDIAFNLLIFFVILARAQDDSHLSWVPAKALELESASNAKVSVVIDAEEKVFVNGQPVGIAQLSSRVAELLGNAPAGEREVILKVHHKSKALTFEPVIEAISQAGGDLFQVVEKKNTQ